MSSPEAFRLSRIGETRVAVMAGRQLLEMHLSRSSDGLQPGAIVAGRLRGQGLAEACGEAIALVAHPAGVPEGALGRIAIVRAAIPERHRLKPARGAWQGPADGEGIIEPAAPMAARLQARGIPLREEWPGRAAEAWDAAWEEAELGEIRLPSGRLSLVPTPAGVAVDVDGSGPALALDAADALACVIPRWGIGGNLLVDFPALDRAARLAVAARLDFGLSGISFERTGINGFGLLQLVLPRSGPSILERAWFERGATLALDLLEAAIREPRPGPLCLFAPPSAAAYLGRHPDLLDMAARRAGRRLDLVPLPAAGSGHVAPA